MNYNEYLFGELLKLKSQTFRELEYDLQFEALPVLYREFDNSKYNTHGKAVYTCITLYLQDNVSAIDKELTAIV